MPVTNNKKLLFFNKEGYPYNFELDTDNIYKGKLIFDENSSDTFKTLGIYIFEEVDPFVVNDYFTLNKMEIYNTSGISFHASTFSGETITNITRVNSSEKFYSKWIVGEDFDSKFPKGTLVSFSGVSFIDKTTKLPVSITDFNNNYYTVLDNRPNAILVNTKTDNRSWNNTFVTGNTIINSHNTVCINDYNNTLYPQISNWTLHNTKKFSILGTELNDGVHSYINNQNMKTIYQTYDMSNVSVIAGDILKFNFELKTERPKLYQGPITFIYSGTGATLQFGRQLNSNINLGEGQQIIFEDYNDNPLMVPTNPIFTILDGTTDLDLYTGSIDLTEELNVNKTYMKHFSSNSLSSQVFVRNMSPTNFTKLFSFFKKYYPKTWFEYDYYIQITGTTSDFDSNLSVGDIISLSASTHTTGTTRAKNANRTFNVLEIKTFKDIRIDYWKNKINSFTPWYNDVVKKAVDNLRTLDEQMVLDAIYMYDTVDDNVDHAEYIPISQRYEKIKVQEYLIPETNTYGIKKVLKPHDIKNVRCRMSISVPNTYMPQTIDVVAYSTSNVLSFSQEILKTSSTTISYEQTINAFNTKYGDYLYDNYGILIYCSSANTSQINIHSVYTLNPSGTALTYDRYFIPNVYLNTTNVSGLTNVTGITTSSINRTLLEFDEQLKTEKINPNEFSKFDNTYYAEIYFDLNDNGTNNGFTLEINDHDYYISFSANTQTTIKSFINTYSDKFKKMYLNLNSGTSTLTISSDYTFVNVNSLKVKVNSFSSYDITKENKHRSIVISGNELELSPTLSGTSLYEYGLSTGMIFTLSGSQYESNNISYNILGMTETILELSYQGLFFDERTPKLKLDVLRFLRKPRESANKNAYYNFRFLPKDNKYTDAIFFYDVTGNHLKPYLNDSRLTYIGNKPLWDTTNVCSDVKIGLVDSPNKDILYVSDPTKQQTVFKGKDGEYCLEFLLDKYNSETEYDFTPEPLQVFLGFNSVREGVSQTSIVMEKVENIIFSGYTNSTTNQNGVNFNFDTDGILEITTNQINFNFLNYGFEKNQPVTVDFIDQSKTGTTTFNNHGTMTIDYVGGRKMKFVNNVRDFNYVADMSFNSFTTSAKTDGFYYEIKVKPNPILKLDVYGETETEDERFKVVLNNLGVQLNADVEHIFIDSDIDEDGIDYIRLNRKRKEMLAVYPEIYNYIGSYKSLINAINFFGYNDLQLYEYYKNVNVNSPLYQKLQKVLIPDIFDNTVPGWTPTDYISGKYKTGFYKKTNLFNLTYRVTDEEGNNVTMYSLDEVQIKLNKLKRWLKRNILPLSTNIVDITGVAEVTAQNYQNYDVSNQTIKTHAEYDTTSVNFIYSETLNFQTNYFFEVNFYTRNGFVPSGWTCKIQTFSMSTDGTNKLISQKYFKLMKNDLDSFSFNIDKNVDEYLYIETSAYNDYGQGQVVNKMTNTSTSKHYLLINNRFSIPDYNYLNANNNSQYYFFDKDGYIFLND